MQAPNQTVWVYWENPSEQLEIPAHIRLCLKTIQLASGEREVCLLNENTAREAAPSLPDWWDGLEPLAHKADILKAHLLYSQGGLALDVDTIAIRDLEFIFELLERGTEFLGFGPAGDPSIGVLAARRGATIARCWQENQLKAHSAGETGWETYANASLSPVTKEHRYLNLPWQMTHPFPWHEWQRYLSNESAELFGDGTYALFALFNKVLGPDIVQLSEEQLLSGSSLLSQLFRIALDDEERKKFCWRDTREFCNLEY